MELLSIPSDLLTYIFTYISTPELCGPCFTSKMLLDLALKALSSRNLSHNHHRQLPITNQEVVRWWWIYLREPTRAEVMEAARTDRLEVLDLVGWDDEQLSPRHHLLTRSKAALHRSDWDWGDILVKAITNQSTRTMRACIERHPDWSHLIRRIRYMHPLSDHFATEGNLKMIRWLYDEYTVEGLPTLLWNGRRMHLNCLFENTAREGHQHVLAWLQYEGRISEPSVRLIYEAAGLAGRMDVISWMEENKMPAVGDYSLSHFIGSVAVFEWAIKRNIGYPRDAYLRALEDGNISVMQYCLKNKLGLSHFERKRAIELRCENEEAIHLAIDHGFITKNTKVQFADIVFQFPLIKWMHERNVLHSDFCQSTKLPGNLEVLQWAHENGYYDGKVNPMLPDVSISQGSPDMLKWHIQTFGTKAGQMYRMIACDRTCRTMNVEGLEWMLQRKWNESEGEIRRWFNEGGIEEVGDLMKMWKRLMTLM
ncbi:hypothetical protein PROFUN_12821 [Planoprotostelium fungivorum]|uniref:F-box domain-containing protein n=1 Tax=Planoprotostelium fungivorum TaxID=1890364 RepID=A0A2P6N6Q5_9EUKA|nr:hypothetical protein PROFUN_12821 [Planoprotostelium fungivorum]